MRPQTFLLFLFLALYPGWARPQSQLESPPPSVLVKAGKLLDVRNGSYIEGAAIWIEGERIKEAGRASEIEHHVLRNAKVIDLGGAPVLPGLIDYHTHLLARFAETAVLQHVKFVMKGGTVVKDERHE